MGGKETKHELPVEVYDAHPNGWGEQPSGDVPGQIVFGPTSRATKETEEKITERVLAAGKHFIEERTRLEKIVFIGSLAALGGLVGGYIVKQKLQKNK